MTDSNDTALAAVPPVPVSLYEKHRRSTPAGSAAASTTAASLWSCWTQALFYGALWLPWNGRQAILFHLVERKFYLFGLILWPQDVIYLAVLFHHLGLCPLPGHRHRRPVVLRLRLSPDGYTEIFMWIENAVEGDRQRPHETRPRPL